MILARLQTENCVPMVMLQKVRALMGVVFMVGISRLLKTRVPRQKAEPAIDPQMKLKSDWLNPLNYYLGVLTMQSYQISLASQKVVKVIAVQGRFLISACLYPLQQFFYVLIVSSRNSPLICDSLVAFLSTSISFNVRIFSCNILTLSNGSDIVTDKNSAAAADNPYVTHLILSPHFSPNPSLKNLLKISQNANLTPPLSMVYAVLLRLKSLQARKFSKFLTVRTFPKSCEQRRWTLEQRVEVTAPMKKDLQQLKGLDYGGLWGCQSLSNILIIIKDLKGSKRDKGERGMVKRGRGQGI